jgi:hypothetical protein
MAKMFLTLSESQDLLHATEDQIKQMCREGQLREFRDGPRLMFKADQVEALAKDVGKSYLNPNNNEPAAPIEKTIEKVIDELPEYDLSPKFSDEITKLLSESDFFPVLELIEKEISRLAASNRKTPDRHETYVNTMAYMGRALKLTIRGIRDNRQETRKRLQMLANQNDQTAKDIREFQQKVW